MIARFEISVKSRSAVEGYDGRRRQSLPPMKSKSPALNARGRGIGSAGGLEQPLAERRDADVQRLGRRGGDERLVTAFIALGAQARAVQFQNEPQVPGQQALECQRIAFGEL